MICIRRWLWMSELLIRPVVGVSGDSDFGGRLEGGPPVEERSMMRRGMEMLREKSYMFFC